VVYELFRINQFAKYFLSQEINEINATIMHEICDPVPDI
jgi:hypothetical protein